MTLNESNWISIAALAVSTVISISRWAWDAKKETRSNQAAVIQSDAADTPIRHPKRKVGWFLYVLPVFILWMHTFSGGELTRSDFGSMLFAVVLIVGNWVLMLTSMISSVSEDQLSLSQSLMHISKMHAHQAEAIRTLSANVAAPSAEE